MHKSLALFVILCLMVPNMWIDARPAHKKHDMSSQVGGDVTKPSGITSQTGSYEKADGDSTKKSKHSHEQSEDSTKPSGSTSQSDLSEQPAEDPSKKGKTTQEQSGDSTKPSGSSSQVDSSEQPVEDPKTKGKTTQDQSGDYTDPSGSSSQANPTEKTGEDPTKKGETSQEQSGGSRRSTSRATTLHATGHYLGKRPSDAWLSANPAEKSNDDVQAAECAHNLRVHTQNFAYFKIDASKAKNHGAPYGTCYATSIAPEDSELVDDGTYDVFYWDNLGGESGVGTGPILNPETGVAGYEDNEGKYSDGENPDKSP